MNNAIFVTAKHRRQAIEKLAQRGMHLPAHSGGEAIGQAIAMVVGVPIPRDTNALSPLILDFIAGNLVKESGGLPPFKPYVPSKQMLEAVERAHAYHAPRSLVA